MVKEQKKMDNPKFNNHVLVPFAFFDKLMRCYYGEGPNYKNQSSEPVIYEGPTTEVNNMELDSFKNMQLQTKMPPGFVAGGSLKRKMELKENND